MATLLLTPQSWKTSATKCVKMMPKTAKMRASKNPHDTLLHAPLFPRENQPHDLGYSGDDFDDFGGDFGGDFL